MLSASVIQITFSLTSVSFHCLLSLKVHVFVMNPFFVFFNLCSEKMAVRFSPHSHSIHDFYLRLVSRRETFPGLQSRNEKEDFCLTTKTRLIVFIQRGIDRIDVVDAA